MIPITLAVKRSDDELPVSVLYNKHDLESIPYFRTALNTSVGILMSDKLTITHRHPYNLLQVINEAVLQHTMNMQHTTPTSLSKKRMKRYCKIRSFLGLSTVVSADCNLDSVVLDVTTIKGPFIYLIKETFCDVYDLSTKQLVQTEQLPCKVEIYDSDYDLRDFGVKVQFSSVHRGKDYLTVTLLTFKRQRLIGFAQNKINCNLEITTTSMKASSSYKIDQGVAKAQFVSHENAWRFNTKTKSLRKKGIKPKVIEMSAASCTYGILRSGRFGLVEYLRNKSKLVAKEYDMIDGKIEMVDCNTYVTLVPESVSGYRGKLVKSVFPRAIDLASITGIWYYVHEYEDPIVPEYAQGHDSLPYVQFLAVELAGIQVVFKLKTLNGAESRPCFAFVDSMMIIGIDFDDPECDYSIAYNRVTGKCHVYDCCDAIALV